MPHYHLALKSPCSIHITEQGPVIALYSIIHNYLQGTLPTTSQLSGNIPNNHNNVINIKKEKKREKKGFKLEWDQGSPLLSAWAIHRIDVNNFKILMECNCATNTKITMS